MKAQNITLTLLDGTINGIKVASNINWTGKVYSVPYNKVDDLENIPVGSISAIFSSEKQSYYVGKLGVNNKMTVKEELSKVLSEDDRDTALILVLPVELRNNTDSDVVKTVLADTINTISKYPALTGRADLTLLNDHAHRVDILEFVETAIKVMSLLDSKLVEVSKTKRIIKEQREEEVKQKKEINVAVTKDKDTKILLKLKYNGMEAYCEKEGDTYTLLKGSEIRPGVKSYCYDKIRRLRAEYKNNIVNNRLNCDIIFDNPSCAATFVTGQNMRGTTRWVECK